MLQIKQVTVNDWENPVGLDEAPRVGWSLEGDAPSLKQTSYRLQVCGGGEEWDSGFVRSGDCRWIPCEIRRRPATRYTVRLTVEAENGETAQAETWFETGRMGDWQARWITDDRPSDAPGCPVFVKSFFVKKPVARARLYATALGVYDLCLNGGTVGDIHMAPGWTNYAARIEYQTYDLTDGLHPGGDNRLEITVGKGWYRGTVGYFHVRNYYGVRGAALAQLEIQYEDGDTDRFVTDESWQWTTGPVLDSELYDGETVDFTAPPAVLRPVKLYRHTMKTLVAQECPPARAMERLPVRQVLHTPAGETVLDFGQNLTGYVEAALCAPRGTRITLRHAEVLDENGNFYTLNLRGAKAEDTIVCSGGKDLFRARFTYHGFRYCQVEGLPGEPDPADFTAVVCHSDLPFTGWFACSDPQLNQLQHNILWGQKGNFLDIPTDCPQRDERLGWTGDAQMFFNTAAFNMNVHNFFAKWLRDVATAQTPELGCPTTVPDVIHEPGTAAWGDCCTIIPWQLYESYGDAALLREQYPVMCRWLDYVRAHTNPAGLWQRDFQHGDWLALDGGDQADARTGATDIYFVANAFYLHSLQLTGQAARALEKNQEAEELEKEYRAVLDAFRQEYITPAGRLVSDTQTAAVLALHFHLCEDRHRKRILENLVDNLHRHGDHLTTGFVGTPYLCHVLSENGEHELAGKIVMQQDFPSWLYAVNLGATTIWERWNSMNPDRTISDTGMTSFNHYAYGSVGEWFYRKVCGLNPVQPGYRESYIAPRPFGSLQWAQAEIQTGYGLLSCRWERSGNILRVEVCVPGNTVATVVLPQSGRTIRVGSGRFQWEEQMNTAK